MKDLKHPVIREALELMCLLTPQIGTTTLADIPSGTGLGSSGSFTTALLQHGSEMPANLQYVKELRAPQQRRDNPALFGELMQIDEWCYLAVRNGVLEANLPARKGAFPHVHGARPERAA